MNIINRIKENWISYGLIAFNFFVSYMGSFYFAHSLLDVNKFVEAIIIAIIPVFTSIILSVIITPNNKDKVKEYFHWAILPVLIAEKILIPIYEYLTAKNHEFLSIEENLGIPSESDFIIYLLQGKIGSAYYYNGIYLITTIIVILSSYKIIKLISSISDKRKLWLWFISIHFCTLPSIINLFYPFIKLNAMLIWVAICLTIFVGYGVRHK